ncbi:hypothetical protein HBI56_115910 [Parastagonospora nodorum]|uniref:Uncharacterized protein n=1 Tax=Phaeosphaeria nodorum (strain SN15 / ATCC MYA-4574 / FGSC 10173) TaxID=321614 RepID=A0A7U2F8J7_PHANO|nr:hypothetical protein HBH56_238690 [Parastagonospora nodorum]QRD00647.1 hypothetical protein JI435_415550 [Parastagonospora nodorum SN15]KAH3925920.1 hypothetical protein HBH54_177480 [Parastagonospora nodorum]KAH3953331.1 hypothetical protein HBH53_038850 [Parastagonospora nodorum]KAH3976392.1 hypothetical protein HBH52_119800 [Parastagonospora nodorum]
MDQIWSPVGRRDQGPVRWTNASFRSCATSCRRGPVISAGRLAMEKHLQHAIWCRTALPRGVSSSHRTARRGCVTMAVDEAREAVRRTGSWKLTGHAAARASSGRGDWCTLDPGVLVRQRLQIVGQQKTFVLLVRRTCSHRHRA